MEGVPPVLVDGAPVSSTRIREALSSGGDVDLAARLLGRPFSLSGPVVQGFGRGRTIGVPTANLQVPEDLLVPRNGVYLCTAHVAREPSQAAPAVLNIGTRPTFDAGERSVEAHLLDWSGDLYGRSVRLELLRRLRDERRFEGVEPLVAQIHADIAQARALSERLHVAPG